MKFSSALLFAAALCSVQQASAGAITLEAATGIQLGKTDYTDQFKIDATLGALVEATNTIIVTLPSGYSTKLAATDAALVLDTDYTFKCAGVAQTPTSGTTSSSGQIFTIVAAANCADAAAIEITFLKAKITPPGPAFPATGVVTTAGTANSGAQADVSTSRKINKGTFATITSASLKLSSTAATTFANFEVKFTGVTLVVSATGKFTVVAPGYTLKADNQCTLVPDDGSTSPTVAQTGSADASPWEFTLVGTDLAAKAYTFKCDKVLSPAIQDANKFAVIIGDTDQSLILLGSDTLAAVVAATPAPFSAAPASAGVSMAALVLGSFAALCLLF